MVGKKILFRFEAYPELGMGHVFRSMEIIKQMKDHICMAVISKKSVLALDVLNQNNIPFKIADNDEEFFNIIIKLECDIVVNDILNTKKEYVKKLKALGCRVINLEDEGSGSGYADIVVNELYEDADVKENQYYGYKYYCLPENIIQLGKNPFHEEVTELLMLFGGTDPAYLSEKTINAMDKIKEICNIHIAVVIGPGNRRFEEIAALVGRNRYKNNIEVIKNANLKGLMQKADIAICSQGRTMFELAHLAIPTVIMAQNEREQKHTFASLKNGFINLGLGKDVSESCIIHAIKLLIESINVRKELYNSMTSLNLVMGNERVKKLILGD